MKKEIFDQVKKDFGSYSSFALWDENDLNNFHIIEQNVELLHGKVIFIAYNAANPIREFENFHHRRRGGRDTWLANSIGKDPHLKGAYMTDFFKGSIAKKVHEVDARSENIKANKEKLQKEIGMFAMDKPVLVAIGRDAEDVIKKCGILDDCKIELKYIPHYAGRITKKGFEIAVKELSRSLFWDA